MQRTIRQVAGGFRDRIAGGADADRRQQLEQEVSRFSMRVEKLERDLGARCGR